MDTRNQAFLKQIRESGSAYLEKYGNCGQSTFAALAACFGIEDDQIVRASFGFGGGLGGTGRGPCGALSGAALFLSALYGREASEMQEKVPPPIKCGKCMELIQEAAVRFGKEYRGITCHDVQLALMGKTYEICSPEGHDAFMAEGSLEKCCGPAVRYACALIADMAERGALDT